MKQWYRNEREEWKQYKCSKTDEWVKNMWCIYTVEYYSTIKKRMNFATTWVNLEDIVLSEMNQTNFVWYHLYVKYKK